MPAIEVENLARTYPGGVEALRGLSFEVERGTIFALLGPNGAGKSTTEELKGSLRGDLIVVELGEAGQDESVRRALLEIDAVLEVLVDEGVVYATVGTGARAMPAVAAALGRGDNPVDWAVGVARVGFEGGDLRPALWRLGLQLLFTLLCGTFAVRAFRRYRRSF